MDGVVFDYGKAVGQGTQNALAQMQAMQAAKQIQEQNAVRQLMQSQNPQQALRQAGYTQQAQKLAEQEMDWKLKGLDYIKRVAPSVQNDTQYQALKQELISQGFAKPGILPESYDDNTQQVLNSLAGNAQKQYETFTKGGALMQRPVGGGKAEVLLKPTERGALTPAQALKEKKEQEKLKARQEKAVQKADFVASKVDEAVGKISGDEVWTTGALGSLLSFLPSSKAYGLEKTILTVKANIGFDTLQQMREMSPTGGALGQVAVQELENLQATLGSLDVGQEPRQLMENLGNVKLHYTNWKRAVEGQEPLTKEILAQQAILAIQKGAPKKEVERRLATYGIFLE